MSVTTWQNMLHVMNMIYYDVDYELSLFGIGSEGSNPRKKLFGMSCNDLVVEFEVINDFVKWSSPLKRPY